MMERIERQKERKKNSTFSDFGVGLKTDIRLIKE